MSLSLNARNVSQILASAAGQLRHPRSLTILGALDSEKTFDQLKDELRISTGSLHCSLNELIVAGLVEKTGRRNLTIYKYRRSERLNKIMGVLA